MGVDYVQRKQAKKISKRSSSEAAPKRIRKKNQPRRLCRGPCFSPPVLAVDDSEDGDAPRKELTGVRSELSKYANMTFGDDAGSTKKRKQPKSNEAQNAEKANKKHKMSTQVQLIAPKSDKNAASAKKSVVAAATTATVDITSLPETLQNYFKGENLSAPTPVRALSWPHLLSEKDVEAVAEPGSGKTLAYILPAAATLIDQGHSGSTSPEAPLALVLLPTRELAQQVAAVCKGLRKHCNGLTTACLTGGTEKAPQAKELKKGPHIVVATPGRLLDMIDDNKLSLDKIQYVVLDEADKMLSMGFADQIQRIKSLLGLDSKPKKNKKRPQVGLFTATMPPVVRAVADDWLHTPERVSVASSAVGAAQGRAISSTVVQVVQVCAEHKKPAKLLKHLEGIKKAALETKLRHAPRVLIFANRIKTVRFVYRHVTGAGFRAAQLLGERSQEERETAVKDFKSGKAQILVASDVASRGLDIQNLPYVVNYDFPANLETYVHRVGRTGRLAADGHAFSFLTREMAPLSNALLQLLREHDQSVDPNLLKLAEAYRIAAEKMGLPLKQNSAAGGAKRGKDGEEEDNDDDRTTQRPATEDVLRELDMKSKAQKKKDKVAEKKAEKKAKKQQQKADSEEEDEGGTTTNSKPEYIASKKFAGARPGYIFRKGGMGVGYYLDKPPHMHLKALAKAKEEIAAKMAAKPIGGSAGKELKKKVVPLLPGKMKALKKQQQEYYSSSSEDEQEGSAGKECSSSEDEKMQQKKSLSAVKGGVKKHRALPGRLRKKLAKGRQKQAAGT